MCRQSRAKPNKASEIALVEAQTALNDVRARGPAVKEVVSQLRLLRERNHFAERLQQIMEGQGR